MRVLTIERGTGIGDVLLRLLVCGLKKNNIRIIEIFEKNAWNSILDLGMICCNAHLRGEQNCKLYIAIVLWPLKRYWYRPPKGQCLAENRIKEKRKKKSIRDYQAALVLSRP